MYSSGLIYSPPGPVQAGHRAGVATVPDEPDGLKLATEAREVLVGLERTLPKTTFKVLVICESSTLYFDPAITIDQSGDVCSRRR